MKFFPSGSVNSDCVADYDSVSSHKETMRKTGYPNLIFALLFSFWSVGFGSACSADSVDTFDVVMHAYKDSSLQVQEKILARFDEPRHGIFRDIPVVYSRYNADYSLDFHLDSVKDEKGGNIPYVLTRSGREMNIRIGRKDEEVTGPHFYVISYTMRRAVNFFSGKPEIYWNVTGDKWPYPINHAGLNLILPEGVSSFDCKALNYTGIAGSTVEGGRVARPSRNEIYVECAHLEPGEGLTAVVGLPKGAMEQPSILLRAYWLMIDWWPALFIPLLSFFGLYAVWRNLGRDAEPNGPIAPDWNPPKELTPSEVGTLIDERCDMKDVLVCIIDLAARGYLQIREEKSQGLIFKNKTYVFVRRFGKDIGSDLIIDPSLRDYEVTLLKGIFDPSHSGHFANEMPLDNLRERFYSNIPEMTQMIYDQVVGRSLFVDDPNKVRIVYSSAGFFVCLLGLLGLVNTQGIFTPISLGVLLSGVLILFFAPAMPARTLTGVKMRRQSLGFALFARKAEKRRLEMMTGEDPTIFGRLLPYAIALGVADAWADAFEGLAVEPPTWYVSSDPNYVFNSRSFTSNMGSGINAMQMVMPSAPSSSAGSGDSGFSGGSSGGGFGGGGGGSW